MKKRMWGAGGRLTCTHLRAGPRLFSTLPLLPADRRPRLVDDVEAPRPPPARELRVRAGAVGLREGAVL